MTMRVIFDKKTLLHQLIDQQAHSIEEANKFLSALHIRGLSPQTIRAYAFDLLSVYNWLSYSGRELKNLCQSDLLDFVAHERKRIAQPSSINRRLVVCRLLFDFCYPGGLEANAGTSLPAPFYKGPGRDRHLGLHQLKKKTSLKLHVKTPKKLISPLSAEQVSNYLYGLRHYRDIAIVYLMLFCGLRSKEVLSLQQYDISFSDRQVRVFGKGQKERIVPFGDSVATSIEQYLGYERPRSCPHNTLFVCLQGKKKGCAMTTAGLRSLFRVRRKKSSLSNANPHRFRHTFGTDMARFGVSLSVLQKLMGHADPEMTLHYINLSMSDIAEAYLQATIKIQKNYNLN